MKKNFQRWHSIKELLHKKENKIYFHEREVWWCSLGVNVGFEEDGKNDKFERPVLIIRKFNDDMLWAVPLTSRERRGKYYYQFEYDNNKSAVILSQLRLISSKRLLRKMWMMPKKDFREVRKRIKSLI